MFHDLVPLTSVATWLFTTSLKATVIIALIMIIRLTLRDRLPAKWQHALWFLLILRLVLPFELASPISIFNLTAGLQSPTQPIYREAMLQEQIPEPTPEHTRQAPPQIETPAAAPVTVAAQPPHLHVSTIFGWLWFAGVLGLLLYASGTNLRLWLQLRRAEEVFDQRLLLFSHRCRANLGLKKSVRFFISSAYATPVSCGVRHPRIFFPQAQLQTLTDNELEHILMHELAHIKRRDVAVALLTMVLQIIYWFHPLVWFAFFKMRQDRETACDELVLSTLGAHHSQNYGRTLISLLCHQSRRRLLPVAIGLADDPSNLKRRVTMIANFSKKSIGWSVFAIILMLGIAGVALTDTVKLKNETVKIKLSENSIQINGKSVNVENVADHLNSNFLLSNTHVVVEPAAETSSNMVYQLSYQLIHAGITRVQFRNRKDGDFYPAELTVQDSPSFNNSIKFFQKDGKWGYIDDQGNIVIEAIYDQAFPTFVNGRATVRQNGLWGMIDANQDIIVPFQYDRLGNLIEDRVLFQKNDKYGFFDSNGNSVIPAHFDGARDFYNGIAPVSVDKKWGFVNKAGEIIVQPRFEDVQSFMEGMAAVKQDNHWGFIDTRDKLIIPCRYENVNPFSNGLAAIEMDKRWGYINKNAELVIKPQFNKAEIFMDSRAVVQVNNSYGVIDKSGKMIIDPQFDMIGTYHLGVCFAVVFEDAAGGVKSRHIQFDLAGNPLRD